MIKCKIYLRAIYEWVTNYWKIYEWAYMYFVPSRCMNGYGLYIERIYEWGCLSNSSDKTAPNCTVRNPMHCAFIHCIVWPSNYGILLQNCNRVNTEFRMLVISLMKKSMFCKMSSSKAITRKMNSLLIILGDNVCIYNADYRWYKKLMAFYNNKQEERHIN